ncbi:MAG: helix-turn-helix transcriptional regulator [Oscillospiraceae bacterium]
MSLSDELKAVRQRSLLTQEDFAHILSVSPSTVNRWETSKAKPNVSTMKRVRAFCLENDLSYSKVENEWINYPKENLND